MSHNFRVGDRVRASIDCSGAVKGQIYTIGTVNGDMALMTSNFPISCCTCSHTWELITKLEDNINKKMNLIERAKLAFKTEPAKSLIKTGFFTADELPTTEGTQVYLAYLMKKDSAFKTEVVDPILADKEKDNE